MITFINARGNQFFVKGKSRKKRSKQAGLFNVFLYITGTIGLSKQFRVRCDANRKQTRGNISD